MAKTMENRGTLEELRARTSSRRQAARERDDQRFRLASELVEGSRFTIPEQKGYLILPPGSIAEAQPVIDAGNQVVDSIGHDRLLSEYNPRNDTMSRGFLPEDSGWPERWLGHLLQSESKEPQYPSRQCPRNVECIPSRTKAAGLSGSFQCL